MNKKQQLSNILLFLVLNKKRIKNEKNDNVIKWALKNQN